jgi:hypothetical protein
MNIVYQVTVRGRKFESRDLRKLLARAVAEKRSMDRRLRLLKSLDRSALSGLGTVSGTLCAGNAAGV